MTNQIPNKIYLSEDEIPSQYYNLRSDMKIKPAPLLNPATLQPVTKDELTPVFCQELVDQELDDATRFFDIPREVLDFYKTYRPSPLVRSYRLEEALDTPAQIYYKFEGNNTSGSLCYYCSMGVVGAVLNADSVDSTAGDKWREQY